MCREENSFLDGINVKKKRGAAVCFFFHCGMWFDGLLLLQCVARPPALSLIEENQGVTISL